MILAWIILSFFIAIIGSNRKIGYWGTFFLSLILSPIVGAIFALASERKLNTTNMVKCPYCAEYIKKEAVLCKHCNRNVNTKLDFNIDDLRT